MDDTRRSDDRNRLEEKAPRMSRTDYLPVHTRVFQPASCCASNMTRMEELYRLVKEESSSPEEW